MPYTRTFANNPYANYGYERAREQAEKKWNRAGDIDEVIEKNDKSADKKANTKVPEPDFYPLNDTDFPPYDYIDWSVFEGEEYIADLVTRMERDELTLLTQGTGVGKTAISVFSLGELQKILREDFGDDYDLPFIVVASRSIHDQGSWGKTLSSYNKAFPEKRLRPIMFETYERFTKMCNDKKRREELKDLLTIVGIIVIDEVHNYKTPTAKRAKSLKKLEGIHKLGASATLTTNHPILDIISYLVLAGMYSSKSNFFKVSGLENFLDKHFNPTLVYDEKGRIRFDVWNYGHRMIDEFSSIVVRPDIKVSDGLFPEVSSTEQTIPLTLESWQKLASLQEAYQNRAFDSLTELLFVWVTTVSTDENRLEKMIADIEGETQPLIFYLHTLVGDTIEERLREQGYNPQRVDGRNAFSKLDLSSNEPIIVQYQSGREGVEFINSTASVFYENQPSYVSLVQSRGRNVRRSSKGREISHYFMVSDDRYELKMYERLLAHEDISAEIQEMMFAEILEEGEL